MKDCIIIIPTYNEEKAIGKLLEDILSVGADEYADILILNDRSLDRTAEVVAGYGDRVILLNHICNLGYGAALKTGYFYAVKHQYKYVIQLDGDGQHAVENIWPLYCEIRGADAPDIVIGSRFLSGSVSFPISRHKKLAIRFFSLLIKLFTRNTISDPTSGLQALSRRAFTYYTGYMNFDPKYPDANMLMKMILLGYKTREIPSIMYARTSGMSIHSGLKPVIYMFLMLLSTLTVILRYKVFPPKKGAQV